MDGALASADANGRAGDIPVHGPLADTLRRERVRHGTLKNIHRLEMYLDQRIGVLFLTAGNLTETQREVVLRYRDHSTLDLLCIAMQSTESSQVFLDYNVLASIYLAPFNPLDALWDVAEEN